MLSDIKWIFFDLGSTLMGALFGCSSDNISLHLKNIYEEKELDEVSTTEDFSVVQREGHRDVKRRVKCYNLDDENRCLQH